VLRTVRTRQVYRDYRDELRRYYELAGTSSARRSALSVQLSAFPLTSFVLRCLVMLRRYDAVVRIVWTTPVDFLTRCRLTGYILVHKARAYAHILDTYVIRPLWVGTVSTAKSLLPDPIYRRLRSIYRAIRKPKMAS
jgi:hypothetical protein